MQQSILWGVATCLALCASPLQAKTLFQCTAASGKEIQVKDNGAMLQYRFGRARQPELVLNVPREAARYHPWSGVGGSYHYSIDLPAGDMTYSVNWSALRDPEHPAIYGGVIVRDQNGKELRAVPCLKNRPIIQNLEDIEGVPLATN